MYDTHIWEVILNDASKSGISGDTFPGAAPATTITLQSKVAQPDSTALSATDLKDARSAVSDSSMGSAISLRTSDLIIVIRARLKPPVPEPAVRYFEPKKIEALALAPALIATPASSQAEEEARAIDNAAPAGIYLQLGAFRNADNGERFRTDVDQRVGWRREPGQGLRIVTSALPNGGEMHRVVVGPFLDRQAAEKWASRSQRISGSRPMLLTY